MTSGPANAVPLSMGMATGTLQVDAEPGASTTSLVVVTVMGMTARQACLTASHAEVDDQLGHSLALSADERTLAFGARAETSSATGVDGDRGHNATPRAGASSVIPR